MLLIYLQAVSPRSKYIFEWIFNDELGIPYTTTTDIGEFNRYDQEKINYSDQRTGEGLFIKPVSLLSEHSIQKVNTNVKVYGNMPVLFPCETGCDLGFDIFAAAFYMVSRYEEYLPFRADEHGRFTASESLAYQNNFLQYPVVNIWIDHFKKVLLEKFPFLKLRERRFKAIVTYDIDIAYSFKGRTITRFAGATVKDILQLKFNNVLKRIVSAVSGKDPWDVYDFLENTISKNKLDSIFFFLLGDYSRFDKNIRHGHPLMKELIKKISGFSEIGIHPSYSSPLVTEKLIIEKNRLEKTANKKINKSRQHYLRFRLPGTYRQLSAAGITEEYSMGFAETPGFRAGTCTPFYFYDLENEKATALKIFPITVMDGNFLYYLKLKPAESLAIINELILEVKKVNGTFISIWHNNTVSDDGNFKDWKCVHNEMIKKLIV